MARKKTKQPIAPPQLNHFSHTSNPGKVEWLSEPLVPFGLNLIAGFPGAAKSVFAEYICFCVAYGIPILGFLTQSGPAVYVNNDHPILLHKEWFRRFAAGLGLDFDPPNPLVTIHHELTSLKDKPVQERLEGVLRQEKPILLVIDRLSTTLGESEDKSENVEPLGIKLREWSDKYTLTVILLHHFTKEPSHLNLVWMESHYLNRLRGSGAILGMADGAMELVATKFETVNGARFLREFGVRPHPKRAIVTQPFSVGLIDTLDGVRLEERGLWKPIDSMIEQIGIEAMTLFSDPSTTYTVKQVEDKFGGAYYRNDVAAVLKYLAEKGELVWTRKGSLGGTYIYQKA